MLHQPHSHQHVPDACYAVGKPQNDKFYGSALLFRHLRSRLQIKIITDFFIISLYNIKVYIKYIPKDIILYDLVRTIAVTNLSAFVCYDMTRILCCKIDLMND